MWYRITRNIFLLVFITIGLFFIVYGLFRNDNYYVNSIKINAFFLPLIYMAVVFYTNYELLKKGNYNLKEGFITSVLSLFVAGIISYGFIFFFLSYIDKETELLLRTQWIETLKKNAVLSNPKNLKEIVKALDSNQMRETSILSNKNLIMFSLLQSLFYLFISFFISFFIRTRA